MQQLTPEELRVVNDLSKRYDFSPDAITHMMFAVLNGNGSMAQFDHSEFLGSGQWMRGGMIMLGDMFNNVMKGRVDALCQAISNILATEPELLLTGSFQSQNQGSNVPQQQARNAHLKQSSMFVPDPHPNWWPLNLGPPNATGTQDNMRYAYFAKAQRLAVETGGNVWIYDTQDHRISGFSQQQGRSNSILFTSQYGTMDLASLPVISFNGSALPNSTPTIRTAAEVNRPTTASQKTDIFTAIERLGDLKAKGIITEEEFAKKKAELLSRI